MFARCPYMLLAVAVAVAVGCRSDVATVRESVNAPTIEPAVEPPAESPAPSERPFDEEYALAKLFATPETLAKIEAIKARLDGNGIWKLEYPELTFLTQPEITPLVGDALLVAAARNVPNEKRDQACAVMHLSPAEKIQFALTLRPERDMIVDLALKIRDGQEVTHSDIAFRGAGQNPYVRRMLVEYLRNHRAGEIEAK